MSDDLKKSLQELAAADGVELSDEALEDIAGGYVYHDKGDAAAHRKEAFYVLDDDGVIRMRLDSMKDAQRWAEYLRTSTRVLTQDEFEKMRKTGSL